MANEKFETVGAYFTSFSEDIQHGLASIRDTIKKSVPQAEEVLSYQLPAFKYHGMLIYYSAYKSHYSISFPPPFKVFEVFKEHLLPYQMSKTTVQFPMDKPLPLELIGEMAKYRANENIESENKKKKK
ncbi:iron chaperone [Paenibacillus cymbidii]|uniref:iron chaperone n=1 Tax=Paenibacillus cymbidii TaxID=1639034 RepID=UPI0010811E46|nr:DUF1801 domain-containing protein [Paenibacillus cymbidii]